MIKNDKYLYLAIIALLVCSTCGQDLNKDNLLIKGSINSGRPASPNEFPWQVLLERSSGSGFCGGSIISNYHILTAAHCINRLGLEDYSVKAGGNGDISSLVDLGDVSLQLIHKGYDDTASRRTDDIALIKLKNPIHFNDRIQPIPLPQANTNKVTEQSLVKSAPNRYSLVGWGSNQRNEGMSNTLQSLETLEALPGARSSFWTMKNKRSYFGNVPHSVWSQFVRIKKGYIAFYRKGEGSACRGDSGGGLIKEDINNTKTLIGIASYVDRYCYELREVGLNIFTDVSYYLDWINKAIE
jgi:secreted trypsin-like serine protease